MVDKAIRIRPGHALDTLAPAGETTTTVGTEQILAAVLGDALHVDRVTPDDNFFEDLGADSLTMARFCALARKRDDLPPVSMKDVYRNPTVGGLATALDGRSPDTSAPAPAGPAVPEAPRSTARYVLCGALQFLCFAGYVYLFSVVICEVYAWVAAGSGPWDFYLRAVVLGGAGFAALCLLPIMAKWVLVGRWKPGRFPVWSLAYVRFWLVKTLVRTSPVLLLAVGSPLYILYLRALGARVGRGVTDLSRTLPVCTDLLTIGSGTIIRRHAHISSYRAHDGWIQIAPVTLGSDVVVGEATVIDIGTSMGDGAQLGHSSSLHAGQSVPAGERWHGSPAQPTTVDYRTVAPARCGSVRRAVYASLQVVRMLLLYVPLAVGGMDIVVEQFVVVTGLLPTSPPGVTDQLFYEEAAVVSAVVFAGSVVLGLATAFLVPRLLHRVVRPGRVYRLFGVHYVVHLIVARLSNVPFFTLLFGDSSYIVGYLRRVGYAMPEQVQTGSNFGNTVVHTSPLLVTVGGGTMAADGLHLVNADYSSTSFALARCSIGARNFLGNRIHYPSQGRTGDNCLLATKVMVPMDGPRRENVGLLGSPPFEIPRSVDRDTDLDHLATGDEFRRRLRAKNRYNRHTIGLVLLAHWFHWFVIVLLAMATAEFLQRYGAGAVAADLVAVLVFSIVYYAVLERAATGFRPLRPRFCSIYEPYFWWHERYWKFLAVAHGTLLAGTPFKNLHSRALGARVGRRVFDDGCQMPERTLVSVGDDCTLNAGAEVQSHSQEDGAFKSDHIRLGDRCTVGAAALVHYGTTVGDHAVIAPDSFLMKGAEVPADAYWGGNPARELAVTTPAPEMAGAAR